LTLDTNHVLLLVLGTLVMTALWAMLGVGLGSVLKNQVFAVIGLIVWVMVIDNILRGVVPNVGRFTPTAASASMTADPTEHLLAPLSGVLLLIAYVAVFVMAGRYLLARRDVT
jgi:ABC-2 type transport system permease protein